MRRRIGATSCGGPEVLCKSLNAVSAARCLVSWGQSPNSSARTEKMGLHINPTILTILRPPPLRQHKYLSLEVIINKKAFYTRILTFLTRVGNSTF